LYNSTDIHHNIQKTYSGQNLKWQFTNKTKKN